MCFFKSSENSQKKKVGPDRSVSDNQSSSVTLNELAMKARKSCCNFKFYFGPPWAFHTIKLLKVLFWVLARELLHIETIRKSTFNLK